MKREDREEVIKDLKYLFVIDDRKYRLDEAKGESGVVFREMEEEVSVI